MARAENFDEAPPLARNFLNASGELPAAYLEDFFAHLKNTNKAVKQSTQPWHLLYLNRRGIDYIFTICARLKMPADVRFLAALIFDRYMSAHVQEAHLFINTLDMPPDRKTEQWTKTQCNIIRQLSLRVVTAIQIASKENYYHESLSNTVTAKVLLAVGSPFTPRAVIRSEMRMLRAIDYILPQSPVAYIESILKALSKKEAYLEHVTVIWEHSILFLDVLFSFMNEIIAQLQINIANISSQTLATRKIPVKGDWLLVGCCCLTCAISCIYGFTRADLMATSIAEITGISATDIVDLSVATINFISNEHKELGSHACEECGAQEHRER